MAKPLIIHTPDGTVELVMTDDGLKYPFTKRKWGYEGGIGAMRDYITPLPSYDVMLDGKKIGTVERSTTTFERKPRGSRIVTKRWTGVRWFFQLDKDPAFRTKYGERRSTECETRKAAVEGLLRQRAWRLRDAAEAPADVEFVDV